MMHAVAELGASGGTALLGWTLARFLSRQTKLLWITTYCFSLTLIIIIGLGRHWPQFPLPSQLAMIIYSTWWSYLVLLLIILVLKLPMAQLTCARSRKALTILLLFFIVSFSVLPAVVPLFYRSRLKAIETRLDSDNVCLQQTDYTCGPAAAVTALRRMGLPAEESELSLEARTSGLTGTMPDLLARSLEKNYRANGLKARYRHFRNLDELRKAGPVLVLVRYNLLLDHYYAVLSVDDQHVVVGDPLEGIRTLEHRQFLKQWRKMGIELALR